MNTLESFWSRIQNVASIVNFPTDIIDIAIITFLVYKVLTFSKSRTAAKIIKAVVLLLVVGYASEVFHLNALNYLVSTAISVGVVALVVVFQPELRRGLERLGGGSLKYLFVPRTQEGDTEKTIEQTVQACRAMSRQKVGALIVFQRNTALEDYFKNGTVVDGLVSAELLKNIFFPKAALHDGAVIIRDNRVAAAGCVLPLTENPDLSRELGTRHRAAIGISEHSDAVVVVVSEETGVVSCVAGGHLKRYLTPENLAKFLRAELMEEVKAPVHHRFRDYLTKNIKTNEEDSHEEE